MEPIKHSPQARETQDNQEPAGPSTCPLCGSHTVPLRGLLRCSLCSSVICETCEGGESSCTT